MLKSHRQPNSHKKSRQQVMAAFVSLVDSLVGVGAFRFF